MNTINHPINQINFKQSGAFLIEASAGTGKTWTLERLYIKALLEGSNPQSEALGVENILVVTFTKDAVQELKVRIYKQILATIDLLFDLYNNSDKTIATDSFSQYLKSRSQEYDIKKDLLLLNRAKQRFDAAAIYTIHKFCGRVISTYPIYFNVDFHSDTHTDKSIIIKNLIINFMRERIITNKVLNKNIETVLNNINVLFDINYKLPFEEAIFNALPKDLFTISENGVDIKYEINVKPDLSFLTENDLEIFEHYKAQFLSSVIEYLEQRYLPVWKQCGGLSYDEMIEAMAFGVRNSKELRDLLYTLYPISFIDEFQDTDNLQWQIFSLIYDDIKRGNLVVVGDPKQAIYSFRGADIAAYINAKKIIARSSNSNLLALSSNFRSHPNIMNFVNRLFDRRNHNNEYFFGEDIDYLQSTPERLQENHIIPNIEDVENILIDNDIKQKVYVENVQIVVIEGKTAAEREENTILNMTFEILTLLATDVNMAGKIAVLVSNNIQANKILKYFRAYGIRASELKTSNIYVSKTAIDLYSIMDALLNLSDEALVMKALITDILGFEISKFDKNNILQFKKYLFAWKRIWDQNGILALTYKIISDMLRVFQHQMSNRELSNLIQLSELLNIQAARITNQNELLVWFKNQIRKRSENPDSASDNNEELIRLDNDDEQIVITTHHKAKGLEYEIVFCPFFRKNPKITEEILKQKLPYFKGYYENGIIKNQMLMDKVIVSNLLENEAKEAHRLNYVALTRAKSRLYIYLKQHTISYGKNYHASENPEKLVELFGYKKNDIHDRSHSLFNYPDFFGLDKSLAIKDKSLFLGVKIYSRGSILENDLIKLKVLQQNRGLHNLEYKVVSADFISTKSYQRQSYTSITNKATDNISHDYYENREDEVFLPLTYRYQVLNDPSFSGAVFGILFHELCENFPLSLTQIESMLIEYNVSDNYAGQLYEIIDIAFKHQLHPYLPDLNLYSLTNKMHELKFNITIKNTIKFKEKFSQIISQYFGEQHKFSQAIKSLDVIEKGFLVGAIDLFFCYDNKYWILDYKTNRLNDYASIHVSKYDQLKKSSIIDSMAEHHYYLQYIIYLVVIKRHLEQRLNIENAGDMIGGAIYFYVRGLYTDSECMQNQCTYIDTECQIMINAVDNLLKSECK